MAWQQWTYLVLSVLGTVVTVLNIGKPRQPLRPQIVAGMVVIQCLYLALVLSI